jgi:hypothetical protein
MLLSHFCHRQKGKTLPYLLTKPLTASQHDATDQNTVCHHTHGGSGIINIKLKKNKKLGFNGSVNVGVNFATTISQNAGLVVGLNEMGRRIELCCA